MLSRYPGGRVEGASCPWPRPLTLAGTDVRSLVENAPIGIFRSTPEGRYLYANATLSAIYGYVSPEELLGSVVDIAHQIYCNPEEREKLLGQVEAGGEVRGFESRRRRKDGRIIWVSVTLRALRGPDGATVCYDGYVTDVTARKLGEEELASKKRLLETVFDTIQDGLIVLDKDRRVVEMNRSLQTLLGGDDSFLGRKCHEIFHRQGEPCEACPVLTTFETGLPVTRLLHKSYPGGADRWFDVSAYPLFDKEGRVQGAVESLRDMTDRIQSARRLKSAVDRLEAIFANSLVGIAIVSGDRLIERVNSAFEHILGYTQAELEGRSTALVHVSRESFEEFGRRYYDSLAIKGQSHIRYPMRHKSGRTVWCHLSGKAIDPGDLARGVIWIVDDISALKRSEDALKGYAEELTVAMDELRVSKQKAEKANQAKSRFLANVSHEFRTPLNGILGFCQILLQDEEEKSERREYLELMQDAGRHLLKIVNDILDLAKVEAEDISLEETPFDIRQLVDGALAFFARDCAVRGVTLTAEVGSEVPRRLVGDAERLRQVLVNLIGNSVKYTMSGSISVMVMPMALSESAPRAVSEHQLYFSVADTGIGIPGELHEKVFESFTQGDESTTRLHQGTGLGLSISRRIVELLGGAIWLESEEEKGTTVSFTAAFRPCDDRADDRRSGEPSDLAARGLPRLRLLVVEDNRVNLMVTTRMLTQMGHTAMGVASGEEGLELLRAESFDILLLDIQMPGMDGVELLRRIRAGEGGEAARNLPALAVTAHAMLGDRERILADGFDGYLSKPFEREELEAALARVGSGSA